MSWLILFAFNNYRLRLVTQAEHASHFFSVLWLSAASCGSCCFSLTLPGMRWIHYVACFLRVILEVIVCFCEREMRSDLVCTSLLGVKIARCHWKFLRNTVMENSEETRWTEGNWLWFDWALIVICASTALDFSFWLCHVKVGAFIFVCFSVSYCWLCCVCPPLHI